MGRLAVAIELTRAERAALERLPGWRTRPSPKASGPTKTRLASGGVALQSTGSMGCCVSRGSGAPRQIGDDEIAETICLTLETTPPDATRPSLGSMAAAVSPVDDPPHLEGFLAAARIAAKRSSSRATHGSSRRCARHCRALHDPA